LDRSNVTLSTSVRRWAVLGSIGALAVVLAGCSSAESPTAGAVDSTDQEEVSWLYTQTADSGRLEMTDGQATKLVLNDVDPHTIAFSDRPERLTDIVGTEAMTDMWDELFGDDPPNAVLVEHSPEGDTDSVVVVLRRPVFDPSTGTLSYDIEVLADEQHPATIEGIGGDVHEVPPTEFRAVSLFIDDATTTTNIIPPPSDYTVPPPPPPPPPPPSPGPPRPPGY
jgi:hypothetical protein